MATVSPPQLIVHADWGFNPEKRWMVAATFDGTAYRVGSPEHVDNHVDKLDTFVSSLTRKAGGGKVIIGFDFPIGLPLSYAQKADIKSFPESLPRFGNGKWARFYDVSESVSEISLTRPFYPFRPGGAKRAYLLKGLGIAAWNDLLRECGRAHSHRGSACPLFWTLGGNQVGKAAIIGWRDVLSPGLKDKELGVG